MEGEHFLSWLLTLLTLVGDGSSVGIFFYCVFHSASESPWVDKNKQPIKPQSPYLTPVPEGLEEDF